MLVSASRKVSHLPFATPKAVVRLRVVYPLLFDQNQHCFLLNWINQRRKCVVSLRWPSRDFRAQHKPNESVYIGKEFNSHRIILVHQHVLCFIVSEEKMINSCSSEATAIQRQNNCPSLHDESTSSRTPTEQATFVSIYTLQNRRVPQLFALFGTIRDYSLFAIRVFQTTPEYLRFYHVAFMTTSLATDPLFYNMLLPRICHDIHKQLFT